MPREVSDLAPICSRFPGWALPDAVRLWQYSLPDGLANPVNARIEFHSGCSSRVTLRR
jgi:hypothetical protein